MKPLVIGIAGGTASGKSTVAAEVMKALGDRGLHVMHDRYYITMPASCEGDPSRHNFDHPHALETQRMVNDLDHLRNGRPTRLPRYDFASSSRQPEEDHVEPRPVIIVEGILVFAEAALRERFDHLVFVHTPDDIRLLRRIRRDMAERGRDLDEILLQYERTVRPMHEEFVAPSRAHAHVELDGTGHIPDLVQRVLALIPA